MSELPTFQPVQAGGSANAEDRTSSGQQTRGSRESAVFSTPWLFALVWAVTALVTVSIIYLIGTSTGIFGTAYSETMGISTGLFGGGLGAPFAVVLGLVVALRRRSSWLSMFVHYGVLLAACVPAFLFGWLVSGLMWVVLTIGLLLIVESIPSFAVVVLGLGTVTGGAALAAGAYLQRGQVGKWTFILLFVWLVAGAALHLSWANPDSHLFADLSAGSGGAMLLVFAAARPLHNTDSIREEWRPRLRYYAGAFLFTMGTLGVFPLGEGLFLLGEGLMTWIVG